jgi:hypothetical protein
VFREQPSFGATPPTVLTRWILVTLSNAPEAPTDSAASNSHGIASACGASARCFTVPTILLPSFDSQWGPA